MQAFLVSFPLFAILCLNFAEAKSSGGPVTCGSVIKIIHKETVMLIASVIELVRIHLRNNIHIIFSICKYLSVCYAVWLS